MIHKGLIFDLDGVIVDTAKYHYIAWKNIADELKINFTERDNEKLKGVSRNRSFEIILELGNRIMSEEEIEYYCRKKNDIYLSFITKMDKEEIIPGVTMFLNNAREHGYQIALGSASKNSGIILNRLKLTKLFDAIIDGVKVAKAKPDPEVFLKGAQALGLAAEKCIVFEDSAAGIEAAHAGGMLAVGIGSREILKDADYTIPGFENITIEQIEKIII